MKLSRISPLALAALTAAFALVATSCDDPAPPEEIPTDECQTPRDCGSGFECVEDDEGINRCVRVSCSQDSDCGSGCMCDLRRGRCQCGDMCRPDLPESCPPGYVCLGGVCTDSVPPADYCEISPPQTAVRAGETVALGVAGFMTSGALAPLAEFDWTSADEACVSVDATGLVTGAASASATCTVTVTATPMGGGAACSAEVTNFPAVSLPALRAVVLDEFTGDPIVGATLLVRIDSGAGVSALPTTTSDATGVASIADVGTSVAAELLDASVFHDDYTWVTVVHPGSSDLIFFMRRVPLSNTMAGAKGDFDFSEVKTTGDIKLALGGLSIPGSPFDLDFAALLGELVVRDINLEGVGNFQDVPLPSGIYMTVGAATIKDDFQAFGLPGRRVLWGMGGKVSLGDIGPIISDLTGGAEDLDIGGLLAAALPYFGSFNHAVSGNLDIVEVARPSSGEPDDWDFGIDAQTLILDTPLEQSSDYALPATPLRPGSDSEHVDGVLVLLGVVVPGQGTVPLGISAGFDAPEDSDPSDGVVDPADCPESNPACLQPDRGHVIVDFAPPHGGLEGARYITLGMALSLEDLNNSTSTSVIVDLAESLDAGNSFPTGAFLGYPVASTYVNSTSYHQEAPLTGADFYRLYLGVGGEGWQVYFNDPTTGIDLPTPPPGYASRTASPNVQAFQTFGGSFGVQELFEFNGTNLNNLLELVGGFSTLLCEYLEQPRYSSSNCYSGYTSDSATGFCVGGPRDVTAFTAGTADPCAGLTGYAPSYLSGEGTAGICAKVPGCLRSY